MSSNRISDPARPDIAGNATKHDSYREAWSRIEWAQREKFYLEAIAIEESIISDRLLSFLVGVGRMQRPAENARYPGFGQLISEWRKAVPTPIEAGEYDDLQSAVDRWRVERNVSLHGIVKSRPGDPTMQIEEFLEKSGNAAKEGSVLARLVQKWHKSNMP